ncbi:MAG: hypothetical protein AAGB26_08055 [Planctomycetota bacterium]
MNWDDEDALESIIARDGSLNPTRLPEDGVELSSKQIESLKTAITGHHPEHGVALCMYPHHAFLFFDQTGEVIGHIDICFLCSNYSASPRDAFSSVWNLEAIQELIRDIGFPIKNWEWLF